MNQRRLSDVIDYEKHIAPYRIIDIIAGVGAGKNYWAEKVLAPEYRVLVITSRKAKVNEVKGLSKSLDFTNLEKNSLNLLWKYKVLKSSCICNSWQIESYMKNKYIPGDKSTYLWEFFDIIIFDEAHSLVTDATFANAPFYALEFMESVYKFSNKKIIMMTGTHNTIKNLIHLKDKEKYINHNFMEECLCVKPKSIRYESKRASLRRLVRLYNENKNEKWHTIYFATTIDSIKTVINFLLDNDIPEEHIAISYSEEEKHFSDVLMQNKEDTEKYLMNHKDIPDNIKIFISTSKNKEGINIENEHYKWDVFIESHWYDEIQQMWGRVRYNLDEITIIHDARQHVSVNLRKNFDYIYTTTQQGDLNRAFNEWCRVNKLPLKNRYKDEKAAAEIDRLHDIYPYLRYSVIEDKFKNYRGRVMGIESFWVSKNGFNKFIERCAAGVNEKIPFGIKYEFIAASDVKTLFEEYLRQKGFCVGSLLSVKDKEEMLEYINTELIPLMDKNIKPYTRLASALKMFGYRLDKGSHDKNSKNYGCSTLIIYNK